MFVFFILALLFACRADAPPAPLPAHSYQCTLSIILLAALPAVAALYVMPKFTSTHDHGPAALRCRRPSASAPCGYGFMSSMIHSRTSSNGITSMIGVKLWLGKHLLNW